jgi:hypothetical protein
LGLGAWGSLLLFIFFSIFLNCFSSTSKALDRSAFGIPFNCSNQVAPYIVLESCG